MRDAARVPEGWTKTCLGDITEERGERVGRKSTLRVLSSTKHRGLVPSDEYFRGRTIYSEDTSLYKRVNRNWFAYATNHLAEGSIGLQSDLDVGCVSPIYTVFSCRDGINPRFLFRVLKSPRLIVAYRMHEQASVDRRGAVRYRDFSKIEIGLPPLPEQRKIADILDSVDESIRKSERLIAKLELAGRALLDDLLSKGTEVTWRGAGFQSKTSFIDVAHADHLPPGWKMATVGESLYIDDGPRTPISSEVREKMQGTYPYFGPTGVLDHINRYSYSGTRALIGEDGDHFLKFMSKPMTLLVSGQFSVNNHAHVLRGTETARTEWFWLYFLHRDITLHLTRQGAGRFKLTRKALGELPIAIPPLHEQDAIIDKYRAHQNRTDSERTYVRKLLATKQGLMENLLTGRMRVKAEEDELV